MITLHKIRAKPVINAPDMVLPNKIIEKTMPTSGTPEVKVDISNGEIFLPYSAEITKHTEVAIGPIKKSKLNKCKVSGIDNGLPSK